MINFENNPNQLEGWASYFEDLATPKEKPTFEAYYKDSQELQFLLLKDQAQKVKNTHHAINQKSVKKHLSSLKNKKAADLYGITSEHLKFSSNKLARILTTLINKVLSEEKLPSQFMTGKFTPVLKKGKPPKDPNSY